MWQDTLHKISSHPAESEEEFAESPTKSIIDTKTVTYHGVILTKLIFIIQKWNETFKSKILLKLYSKEF